jgi:signal transduction histidine kinase
MRPLSWQFPISWTNRGFIVAFRFRAPAARQDRSASLFVLLALLILLPAACVLWFMNEAVTAQSAAAERSVTESYRGQLRLVRSRVDAHWAARAVKLNALDDPEQQFVGLILDGVADGAVLLDPDGRVAYPDRGTRRGSEAAEIERQLAAAERLEPATARQPHIDRLASRLGDYSTSISATQRLALMGRLRALAPDVILPTEAALRVSLDLVDTGLPTLEPGVFQQTAIHNLSAFASEDDRVVTLYRIGRLEAMMHDVLHEVTPAGIIFLAFPPDAAGDAEAIGAGPRLPGWQLSFYPLDPIPFDDPVRRQVFTYVSVGMAGVAAMVLLGATAGRMFRRHLRLASLKTDLVATVSHELRTPLASMRVLVDGLLADAEIDPVKTREYLELLATENARLSRLIENFLTFSRLERGRHQFAFAAAHPSAIVGGAVEAVRDRLPADCDFRVDIDADVPPLVADADALVTALVNLLDNALKYTPADKRILLQVYRDAEASVIFAVQDNGFGIPAREQRRIFRRFYRVDQRLTRETSGVGLGLSIVDLIVRAHGGEVGVRSEAGGGSTFTLRLPAASDGVAA